MDNSPGPAAAHRRILAQARFEVAVLLLNGEQLLVSFLLPALALIGGNSLRIPDLGPGPRINILAPGVIALALMSSAFTGQAIQTGFDRRYGVLRLLGTTPLGRLGLLGGKVLAVAATQGIQVALLGALALLLGWHPRWQGLGPGLLIAALGTAAFVALALLLAGNLRAEAVLAVANLLWVALLAAGAVMIPAAKSPGLSAQLGPWLPSGALGEGLRAAWSQGQLSLSASGVLLGWAALAGFFAARTFRWSA